MGDESFAASAPKANEGTDGGPAETEKDSAPTATGWAAMADLSSAGSTYTSTAFRQQRDKKDYDDSDVSVHSEDEGTAHAALEGKCVERTTVQHVVAPRAVVPPHSPDSDDYEYDSDEKEALSRRWTCQTIRSKIQKFLATKTMTQTAFLRTIDANSNSFQRFMKLKGSYGGDQNSTYWGSLRFFDQLEKKQKLEKAAAKASGTKAKTSAKRKAGDDGVDETPAAKKKKFLTRLQQIDAVELPADLKVYDDCDVVRANIQAFFLTKVMAQTAFAAHLNVSIASLRKYLARKGKREGVGIVYEAAYRFFEKVRILDNAPKTNKRKKVELERPEGYSLVRDPTHFIVLASEFRR